MPGGQTQQASNRRSGLIAGAAAAVSLAMLGMAFAAVPLYRAFCAATGYNGTPQIAATAPARQGERELVVRFDANVAPGLDWRFEPDAPQITLRTGKTATVFFKVTNLADRAGTAQASFNVGPDSAGAYFDKINCFCFTEQTLAAHETAELPVVFFLDPALERDRNLRDVDIVTLSYTFFAARPAAARADAKVEAPAAAAAKPL